ncbi:hypothetical protein [Yaniella halotolerans]|uniref:hypothetical protein n=1 Tax=Yaniella halotolerans TaxID=225453 RepID=UPI0003B2FB97|nr:hypothetical protein [Yaniella halotolerans]
MDFLYALFLFLHFVGAAALLGGWLANFRTPTVGYWQHLGAWLQLISGLMLVGLAEMTAGDDGAGLNHMKIGIKLVILIAILVAAIIGRRKVKRGEEVSTGIAHAVGGLTLINVAIAVFW